MLNTLLAVDSGVDNNHSWQNGAPLVGLPEHEQQVPYADISRLARLTLKTVVCILYCYLERGIYVNCLSR